MLSKILLLSLEKNNASLLEIIARSVKEMSEGELLQIEKARLLDITEDVYYEIIKKKTASLIASYCEIYAAAVGDYENRKLMREFGENIGIAFQIKDDIFDYGNDPEIGKPTGADIREGKLTLPIIYVLNNAPKKFKMNFSQLLKTITKTIKK